MKRLVTRVQLARSDYEPQHLTLRGTPTQARAFLDRLGYHATHLEQHGTRITAHVKELPMTECQPGLHQPTDGRTPDGRPAVVCSKCASVISSERSAA